MRYGILTIPQQLKDMTIGVVSITDNPLRIFKNSNYSNVALLLIEDDAPFGTAKCVIENNKLILDKQRSYSCKTLDLSKHTLVFEPDAYYEKLSTGYTKEVDLLKISSDTCKDTAFLLFSEKECSKDWNSAVLRGNKLHLPDDIVDVIVLKTEQESQ